VRRYAACLLAGVLLAATGWYAAALWQAGVPTASSAHSAALVRLKTGAASAFPSPKLVTISGSSGQFGIRTAQLQSELGISSYNMGLAAGLGLHHLLAVARGPLDSGDVALLALEYVLLSRLPRPEEAMLDYVFARDPRFLDSIPFLERARLVFAMPLDRMLDGLTGRLRPEPAPSGGPYTTRSINAHGDETWNELSRRGPRQRARVEHAVLNEAVLRGIETSVGPVRAELAAFAAWCASRGVRLLATWPSTLDFPGYHTPTGRRWLRRAEQVYRDVGIETLGRPEDFLYPRSDFFDTAEHLHADAMTRHTRRLAGLVGPVLRASAGPRGTGRRTGGGR
jgi:hypothetical protein